MAINNNHLYMKIGANYNKKWKEIKINIIKKCLNNKQISLKKFMIKLLYKTGKNTRYHLIVKKYIFTQMVAQLI
jgi:hypothetical protein